MSEEIRRASADELAHIRQIWAECWGGPFDSPDTKEMPHFAPLEAGDASILFVDGKPVSSVAYGRKELMIGSACVRFGALGDVATKTSYQRRGYASRLMIEAVRQMAGRGDHVSALFTFSYDYYRRFGWEIGGDSWGLLLYPAEFGWEDFTLPAYDGYDRVRPFRAPDLDEMARLHEANLSRRGWGLVRPAAYWQWAGAWLDEANCIVYEGASRLEGYLVAEVTPRLQLPDEYTFRRTDDPLWPLDVGPVLHIVEIVAESPAARRALVGYLARRARDVAALAFPLARRSDLEASGLLVPPARLRLVPSFMIRVLDVAAALRALDDLPAPDESFSLSVSDPAGINGEAVALRAKSGGLDVVRGPRERHHLTMDIQTFSQVFAGYRQPSDLWSLSRLEASSELAVRLADQVFVQREPFIGELDLF